MSHGIWVTNREAVIHWLERMTDELRRFRDMLNDAQDETLLETFYKAQADREIFLQEPPARRAEVAGAKVDTSQAFLSMLVGGMLAKNIQRAKELPDLTKEPQQAPGGKDEPTRRRTFGDRVAEGVRRDLEKLEQRREEEARSEQNSAGDET